MEPRITRELVGEAKTTEISQSKFEKGMKKYGSKLGHLTLATGISCTIGPILGSTRALSGMASKVWNMTKHDFTEHKLEKLKGQNLSEGDRTKALEKLEKELAESKGKIQKDQKVIISGFLAMLPGVGVIAANSYLKSKDPNIQEKGLEGLVLTNYKNLTKGILGINKKINQVATNFIESKLYPVSGQSIKEHLENPNITEEEGLKQLEKKFDDSFDKTLQPPEMKTKIDLTVDRGDGKEHTLNALFIGNIEEISTRPTMVLFHGNGQTHHDNGEIARYYHDRGFNVFTLTMGGYPGSDPGVKTSEVSTCQDVNAVIQALKNKGAKEIGVHGTSIGGTLAFTAADQHPDVVKFVVADQTLNKGNDVAINFVKNMIIPNDTAKKFLPGAVLRGAAAGLIPEGREVPGVIVNGQVYKTDGLNNIRKAENFKGELFVIKSERDDFMGFQPVEKTEAKVKTTTTTPSKTGEEVKTTIKNVQSNKYGRNLADDLLQAKYKDSEEKDSKQVTFKGGHCSWEPEKLQGLESSLEQAFPSIAAA